MERKKTEGSIAPKAPAPKGRRKTHTKPAMPKWAKDAGKVTEVMYSALTAEGAPRTTPKGYVMGVSMVLKMLIDQAVQQGEDRQELKGQAIAYIQMM